MSRIPAAGSGSRSGKGIHLTWTGDDWEENIHELLSLRYGVGDYQRVPAKHKGDCGIESYSRSDAHAYQCYAPDEPLSVGQRLEKQKRKMTADIRKFIRNSAALSSFLKPLRIRRWVFVVPVFDSIDLLKHAAKKSDEVRRAALAYAATDFQISVADESDFAEELQRRRYPAHLHVSGTTRNQNEVVVWKGSNMALVEKAAEKLHKIGLEAQIEELLLAYLRGADVLADIRARYPATHARLIKEKTRREALLGPNRLRRPTQSSELDAAFDDYCAAVRSEAPTLRGTDVELLGWEAVGEWLMRCPLEL